LRRRISFSGILFLQSIAKDMDEDDLHIAKAILEMFQVTENEVEASLK